jgi:methylthioribose-1-phosphate isomerase
MNDTVTPARWKGDRLELLDQTRLPHEEVWIEYRDASSVADAIRDMIVRGAPAIGVTAAYGLALEAAKLAAGGSDLRAGLATAAVTMRAARPTAVNLAWAVDRMMRIAGGTPDDALAARLAAEAVAIHEEDVAANRVIGRLGAALLGMSSTVLTHCNAGALATGGYGTALGVVRAAREAGKRIAVFADETRPYLQGARLTAWELQRDGIETTLITDSMAGHFFQKKTFDAVIVGADRIARNGDAANKIGTYTVAVLANAHGVPFYVAAPVSTIDPACPSGDFIPIEERSAAEVVEARGFDENGRPGRVTIAPPGIAVRHPAFDVTPASHITAIITERGVLRAPYEESIGRLFPGEPEARR